MTLCVANDKIICCSRDDDNVIAIPLNGQGNPQEVSLSEKGIPGNFSQPVFMLSRWGGERVNS